MKRISCTSNDSLMVSYQVLDDWTKAQDLTVFDGMIKVIKENNISISKEEGFKIPDYLLEEQEYLETIKSNRKKCTKCMLFLLINYCGI